MIFYLHLFLKNARFHRVYGEFENIPLKKNNFDLVICNFSLNRVQSKKRILIIFLIYLVMMVYLFVIYLEKKLFMN